MPGTKHQSEATRRQQILSAADLVLIEDGIDGFTIDAVLKKASLGKGTVYRYFNNKSDLLFELSLKGMQILLEKFKTESSAHNNNLDKIKAIFLAGFKFYREYPHYFNLISYTESLAFGENIQDYVKISHAIQEFFEDIINEGQKSGEIRKNLNPSAIDYIIWACCVGLIQFVETKKQLIKDKDILDSELLITTFSDILIAGLKEN